MSVFIFLLWPLSVLFGLIVAVRRGLYRLGLLKSLKLNIPVISVGNLTVGGTGKTPFVDVLLSQLEASGKKVGVLSRGYGRSSKEITEVRGDAMPEDVGDEPLWLKRRHPRAQIIVGADRARASRLLSNVDVVILEDGRQHYQIKRDLEITLLDATQNQGDYHLLPMGRAREPWSSLKKNPMVILTRCNLVAPHQVEILAKEVMSEGVSQIYESQTVLSHLRALNSTTPSVNHPHFLQDRKVMLCSGIAKPESFEALVKLEGAIVVDRLRFKDHEAFDEKKIWDEVSRRALESSIEMIVITEKDAVKWEKKSTIADTPIYVFETKMTFSQELPALYEQAAHYFH